MSATKFHANALDQSKGAKALTTNIVTLPRKQSGSARALALFGRAVLVHCPNCGSGNLFEHWFKIKESCPRCDHVFGRNESGYQIGSMALDMVIPMLLWLAGLATTLIVTWPTPPWALIQWGSIAIMVGLPLLLYPMSHTLAIALDLLVRPLDESRERDDDKPR